MTVLTHDLLLQVLDYDPDEGSMIWKYRPESMFKRKCHYVSWNKRYAGRNATETRRAGYPQIRIFGKSYAAHRVAWFYVHGAWPEMQVDHINRVKHDYRITNLRCVEPYQNGMNVGRRSNNTSGVTGASWDGERQSWKVSITTKGKRTCLGYFDNLFDAAAARIAAQNQMGFARDHGR